MVLLEAGMYVLLSILSANQAKANNVWQQWFGTCPFISCRMLLERTTKGPLQLVLQRRNCWSEQLKEQLRAAHPTITDIMAPETLYHRDGTLSIKTVMYYQGTAYLCY